MAVAFDAVGPSASGTNSATSPLSWTHTLVSGTNSVVLVWVTVDEDTAVGNDSGYVYSVTCGGTPMNPVAGSTIHSNGQAMGFGTLFQLTGVTSGAKAIVATLGGTGTGADELSGGSISFTGASQSTPLGSPTVSAPTGTGTTTAATATLTSNTNGNLIAGFIVAGSRLSSATSPSTSRFISPTVSSPQGAGAYSAGATSPATGSPVVMAWTISSADWYGECLVEVLPAGAAVAGGKVRTVQQAVKRASLW